LNNVLPIFLTTKQKHYTNKTQQQQKLNPSYRLTQD